MMIPWVDVIERDGMSTKIIQSYPFPDMLTKYTTIPELVVGMTQIPDINTSKAYMTRLHFIMNRWHPRNFLVVTNKEWKYRT